MHPETKVLRVLLVPIMALAISLGAARGAAAQSDHLAPAPNNNRIIDIQNKGGVRKDTGKVTIDFLGFNAFRITSPRGITVVTDPWRNDPSGAWGFWFYPQPEKQFPRIQADITLSTHAHFDHDAIMRPMSSMVLDRIAGTFELGDVRITGAAEKHACKSPGWNHWDRFLKEVDQTSCPPNNPAHMDNVLQVVEAGGLRILHWGDNRHNPSPEALAIVGKVDVLLLPIDDSQHILSFEQVAEIIKRLDPHVVIPCHYYTEGVSMSASTLYEADGWVAKQPSVTRLKSHRLTLEVEKVRKMKNHVMYFREHYTRE
jgi:L-ascorbate metabolism protein UlaG (beta-lactamase superfamily)